MQKHQVLFLLLMAFVLITGLACIWSSSPEPVVIGTVTFTNTPAQTGPTGESGPAGQLTATKTNTPQPAPTVTQTRVPRVARQMDIPVSQDTFVVDYSSDKPLGAENTFWIYQSGEKTHAYLDFSLDDLKVPAPVTATENTGFISAGDVITATVLLNLQEYSSAGGKNMNIELLDPKTAWDQKTLTYGTWPLVDPGAPIIQAMLAPYTGSGAFEQFDITTLLQYALAQGYGRLGLTLSPTDVWGDISQEWYSRESGHGPLMRIAYWSSK